VLFRSNDRAQFRFYLEIEVPASESELKGALNEIERQAENVRNLGRYSRIDLTTTQTP